MRALLLSDTIFICSQLVYTCKFVLPGFEMSRGAHSPMAPEFGVGFYCDRIELYILATKVKAVGYQANILG